MIHLNMLNKKYIHKKKLYNLLIKNIFQTWNLRYFTLRETVMTIQGPKYSTEGEIQLSRFTRKCWLLELIHTYIVDLVVFQCQR